MLIILGGTIFSVLVEYPNWFANIPSSLETTRNFYKVFHPGLTGILPDTGRYTIRVGQMRNDARRGDKPVKFSILIRIVDE